MVWGSLEKPRGKVKRTDFSGQRVSPKTVGKALRENSQRRPPPRPPLSQTQTAVDNRNASQQLPTALSVATLSAPLSPQRCHKHTALQRIVVTLDAWPPSVPSRSHQLGWVLLRQPPLAPHHRPRRRKRRRSRSAFQLMKCVCAVLLSRAKRITPPHSVQVIN